MKYHEFNFLKQANGYRSPEEYDPKYDNMIPEDDWEAREERANDLEYRRQADYEMDEGERYSRDEED